MSRKAHYGDVYPFSVKTCFRHEFFYYLTLLYAFCTNFRKAIVQFKLLRIFFYFLQKAVIKFISSLPQKLVYSNKLRNVVSLMRVLAPLFLNTGYPIDTLIRPILITKLPNNNKLVYMLTHTYYLYRFHRRNSNIPA